MTGDIGKTLLSSEAADSLRMEGRMADLIRSHKWDADRGIYYTDPDSGKLREMDVYGVQVFNRPQKHQGTGVPLINLYLLCECKALSGWNILLSDPPAFEHSFNRPMRHWIGWEDQIQKIVLRIAEQIGTVDSDTINALHEYAMGRAYPNEGRAINWPVSLEPPPVETLASAFRETKGGKLEDRGEINRANPFWSAIRSSLSAVEAMRRRAENTSLGWVHGLEPMFHGLNSFKESVAFFLDAELLRTTYFHPFIVLSARLWKLDKDELKEVNSARIFVRTIEHDNAYVDVVREQFAEQYIHTMVSHYEKISRRSIRKFWKSLEETEWYPAGNEDVLERALRI